MLMRGDKSETTTLVASGAAAIALGALLASAPRYALPISAAFCLLAVQALGWQMLVVGLFVATFVTRYRARVLGLNARPEHFLALALLVSLVLGGRIRRLVHAATDRTALLFGLFIAWQAVVSIAQAPDPRASLAIVGWLALDWLILVTVLAAFDSPARLERDGIILAGLCSAVALGMWAGSLLHVSQIGTQLSGVGGARAAYGLSWEANILGGTIALWTFVGLSSPSAATHRWTKRSLPFLLLAIAATFTRAAVAGLVMGLLIWGVFSGGWARARIARAMMLCLAIAGSLVVLAPGVVGPIGGKLQHTLDLSGGGGQYRVQVADQALHDVTPISAVIGLGTETFSQRHLDFSRPSDLVPGYLPSLPLQIFYDSGLVGLVLLGLVVGSLRPFETGRRGRALGLIAVYIIVSSATSPFWFGTTWFLVVLGVLTRDAQGARDGLRRHDTEVGAERASSS